MKTPHHLRFAKALVLSALLPACGGSGDSTPTDPAKADTTQTSETTAPADPPPARDHVAAATDDAGAPADAAVDSGLPFFSGPIAPPELPVGFA
jgi:hypothetical protein